MFLQVFPKKQNLCVLPFTLIVFLLLWRPCHVEAMLKDYRSLQKNVSYLLDNLLNPSRYDKRIRPGFGGPPAVITVNMLIKSMGPVLETDEEYMLDCYFRQTWHDLRLKFQFAGMDTFSLPWLFLDRVWKPDTFFMNGKKSHLHRITVPNKFLRLSEDGAIVYSMRLTVKASCPMHLRKFPLDSQRCPLLIGSYGYLSEDVIYRWKETDAVVEEGVELAQYDLVNISTQEERIIMRGNDKYSMIKVSFLMKRHTGYFMLQVFAPCILIVCCSWVSFWIDPDAVPARVSLGVTTVLSMTTMGFGGRAQMPRVSYATALDWFVILCFSFVFAVMVEYAFINFIDKITGDLRRILEEKGIKKPTKPEPPAQVSATADGPVAAVAAPTVVPLLVVDLAPSPSPSPTPSAAPTADASADPIYAEVLDAVAPTGQPRRDNAHHAATGRTPVLHSERAVQEGQDVLLASMVLSPKEESDDADADEEEDTAHQPLPEPTTKRRRRRAGAPLTRRRSMADLPRDVERGHEERRRASALPGSSTLLAVPGLGAGADDDFDSDFEDGPPLDALEALEVKFRGSMVELREALGSATVETSRSLRQLLLRHFRDLRDMRLLPTEQTVTRLIMSDDPPPKFSKIDIASRRYFPMLFCFLIALYWILYIYYITDEMPVKTVRVLNTQHLKKPPPAQLSTD